MIRKGTAEITLRDTGKNRKDLRKDIESCLSASGTAFAGESSEIQGETIIALTIPAMSENAMKEIADKIAALISDKTGMKVLGCRAIMHTPGNAESWYRAYPGYGKHDISIVRSLCIGMPDFLSMPERISDYIDRHFIGKFETPEEFGEYLSKTDEDYKSIPLRKRRTMNIAEYYADLILNETWRYGSCWFWK